MSQVTEQSVRFQTALASIKLIQASAVLDLTEDDFDFLTSNKVWIATDRSRARRCVEACVYGTLDFVGYPRFPAPVEFIAAVIAYYVHPVNIQTACLIMEDACYGFRCCHLKNIWTAPLPPETELSRQMTTSTTSIDIMGLQAAYANLHTDQERDYFMQRYHDVISSFGGETSYDADNRPLLVMRSNLWASGYDVDGTDQTSLGQFSGRVQQTYKHSVPRFFVPEHGTMFTLALVRFPPTATKEIQYLIATGALTYTDIAGDPVLYGNLPPRELSMTDVSLSGDSSKQFKIAEGQWHRYAPSYVSPAYHLLEGFPFIQEPPSGDLQERVLIRHHDYDQCFQSVQLLQWNSQVKFNVTVYRNLPTTRDSIMTS